MIDRVLRPIDQKLLHATLYDSLIVVVPSLDLVIVRAGKSWKRTREDHYSVLAPFLDPIVAAVRRK
jgi:hypothetical protein